MGVRLFLCGVVVLLCGLLMAQEGEEPVTTPKPQEEKLPIEEKKEEPKEEKKEEPLSFEFLRLNIAWCGIARFDYYSSDNIVDILQDGAVILAPDPVHDTFWMKAAYLYAQGKVGDIAGSLLLNFANKGTEPLCWLYVEFPLLEKFKECFKLRVGQFIKPFGRQTRTFPYELPFGRYGQIYEWLFDDEVGFYDTGFSAYGSKTLNFLKLDLKLDYELGFFNGERMNERDTGDQKATCGRIELSSKKLAALLPFKCNLFSFGFSYFNGGRREINDAYDTKFLKRRYYGFDVELRCLGNRLGLLFEYVSASDDLFYVDSMLGIPIIELNRVTDGWFVELGYFVWVNKRLDSENAPIAELRKRLFGLQIAFLLDVLNMPPNWKMEVATGESSRPMNIYGLAVSYDIRWNIKLQVILARLDYGRYYSGLYAGVDDFSENRLTVQLGFIAF
ncbi:MAG: hypothetical protein N2234_08450 [Planctomycetota bacterium]|nr:hypothetical protein [Planctomycetota bacterium]